MKSAVAGLFVLSLVSITGFGQTTNQRAKRGTSKIGTLTNSVRGDTVKICQGVPIPEGYIIVAFEKSSSCAHGSYVLKKDEGSPVPQARDATTTASRPRKGKRVCEFDSSSAS